MNTPDVQLAATIGASAWVFMAIGGLVIVGLLLAAFAWGRRVRDRESDPPTPEEQPKMPEGGPVYEVREYREPDEVPKVEGDDRLTPHELTGLGGTGPEGNEPHGPGKDKDDGGGFGSGGLGG
ncbi:DUF6479 family protein [Streptomyces sp. NBC_00859]|uniref:DUF6479 family protein n=1 Tax=Streptomyces sp. NBC_00859 TaxID=2903682 RepID=UPI003863A09D|nr:DUF998 domain-containing protein [Streptomyces sp. NBC_00859]